MISEDDKNKVRDATDLVALVSETVELRPRGNTDLGVLPVSRGETPVLPCDTRHSGVALLRMR